MAGPQVIISPSAFTSYVSGLTSIFGHLLFKIISFLEIALVFSTGNKSFLILASFNEFFSYANLLVKITEDFSNDVPNEENIGLVYTGCGVGIDAFGSPI